MKKLLLLLTIFVSASLASCGDDPVAVDPNAGRRATISAFYAHPDVPVASLNVSVDDSITVAGLGYGQFGSGLAPVGGSKKIRFEGLSGTELATSNEVNIDSGRSIWGVYTGLGTSAEDEAFAVSTPYGPAIGATLAGVRFIHASKNAPKVKVMLNVAAGSSLTNDFVEYKGSNNAFTQIGVNTTALVAVNDQGVALATLDLSGVASMVEGKRYTVILYGNANSTTTNPLTLAIKLEPGQ